MNATRLEMLIETELLGGISCVSLYNARSFTSHHRSDSCKDYYHHSRLVPGTVRVESYLYICVSMMPTMLRRDFGGPLVRTCMWNDQIYR